LQSVYIKLNISKPKNYLFAWMMPDLSHDISFFKIVIVWYE